MERKLFAVVFGLLALGHVACQARPVGLSAQAGSTVMIPVGGLHAFGTSVEPVGYGGSEFDDPVRGSLVVQLGGPGGYELVTRGAFSLSPATGARYALSNSDIVTEQVLLIVDIPVDAPLGTHDLYVLNRRNGVDRPLSTAYHGDLTILPNQIDVNLPGGGIEVVLGTPTSAQYWDFSKDKWKQSSPFLAVPPGRLAVSVSVANEPPQGDPRRLSAITLRVDYPSSTIDVVGASSLAPQSSTAWTDDDGMGTAYVHGISLRPTNRHLAGTYLLFELDDLQVPLDPSQVSVTVTEAADQYGTDVKGEFQVSAAQAGIF